MNGQRVQGHANDMGGLSFAHVVYGRTAMVATLRSHSTSRVAWVFHSMGGWLGGRDQPTHICTVDTVHGARCTVHRLLEAE